MDYIKLDKYTFKDCVNLLQNEKINEYGFTPMCVYAPLDGAKFCKYNDFAFVSFTEDNQECFTVLGDFNSPKVKNFLKDFLKEKKVLRMNYLSKEKKDILLDLFYDKELNISTDKSQYDYLYDVSDFLNMSGNQNRHKREQYNTFIKNNNFKYCPLNTENAKDCLNICDKWCERKICENCEYTCEKNVINEIVNNLESFPVEGGIIYIDNIPSAFLIGEALGDTFMGYHQKTISPLIKGLGCAIYIEAFKNNLKNYKYFNMGPDLGIEGLKQFKRMFKPFNLVEKYSLIIKQP